MKKCLLTTLVLLIFIIQFSSCVKKPLIDPEDYNITIVVDWSGIEQNGINEDFVIRTGDNIIHLAKGSQPEPLQLSPGSHNIIIYNNPSGIYINYDKARMFTNNPDNSSYLYSTAREILGGPEEPAEVTLKPLLNTGNLSIIIHDSSSYEVLSISGKLENVAGSYNLKDQTEEDPQTVLLNFNNNSYSGNIFGFTGNSQMLNLEALINDTIKLKYNKDISPFLNGFNDNKSGNKILDIVIYNNDLEVSER